MFALFLQVQFSYIFIRNMYGKLNSPNSINKFYFENQLTTIDIVFTLLIFAGLLFFEVIFVLSGIRKRWKYLSIYRYGRKHFQCQYPGFWPW